ncbi:MAG: hypothetical protein KIIPBIDF_00327 [Candidatus Methanoperedenaceae archaeon GB50]|nr:MAG: hypothetical protein KIIPBIDF_00327 [Candidatus Methanoperedenaceae archaeon GB50]
MITREFPMLITRLTSLNQITYLKENTIYRWQRDKNGMGRHLGKGYSDHLPIFAYFSTEPFYFKNKETTSLKLEETKSPQGLINLKHC